MFHWLNSHHVTNLRGSKRHQIFHTIWEWCSKPIFCSYEPLVPGNVGPPSELSFKLIMRSLFSYSIFFFMKPLKPTNLLMFSLSTQMCHGVCPTSPSLWFWCDPSGTRHMYTTYTASSRWCIMLFLLHRLELRKNHMVTEHAPNHLGSLHLCICFHDLQMFCRWDANKKPKNCPSDWNIRSSTRTI